ncbi:hypothetical protein HPB49_010996 [Dermacentor silvarum]|uniref:Uncharacterized protein n=1 Tax=Dermacentor silvarum TaxID=543639 RepID=A0ACB8D4M5_DERSI|nr:hypothetical protein HPB49_010996 [Dermacentor silvarum]
MLTLNIDVSDSLVNEVVGHLKHVQFDEMGLPKCLWLYFHCRASGNIARLKCNPIRQVAVPVVPLDSIPIELRTATLTLDRKTATTPDGLYLTNVDDDFTFHHGRENQNRALADEFRRLQNHQLNTIAAQCFAVLQSSHTLAQCNVNMRSLPEHTSKSSRPCTPRGKDLRDVLQQLGLQILNTGLPTFFRRSGQAVCSAIDISVATEGYWYSWAPLLGTWGSDHLPLLPRQDT